MDFPSGSIMCWRWFPNSPDPQTSKDSAPKSLVGRQASAPALRHLGPVLLTPYRLFVWVDFLGLDVLSLHQPHVLSAQYQLP